NDFDVLLNMSVMAPEISSNTLWIGMMSLMIINTQVFRSKAYKLASSGSQLAPLIFTNFLFTAVWQSLFFEDRMSQSQIVGMSLIVLAIILNTCWVR
ncbi:EamA family transporter, partial [Vibrio parahaemolyticus]|nr:EamA family transporter [Vibrio parahaemolyticus]